MSSSSNSPPPSPLPSSPSRPTGKEKELGMMKELKMKQLRISSSKQSSHQLENDDADDDDELVTTDYSSSDDDDSDDQSVQYSDSIDQYSDSDVDPNLKAAKKVTATGKKESTKKKGKKDMRLGKQNKQAAFGNRKSSHYYRGELDH